MAIISRCEICEIIWSHWAWLNQLFKSHNKQEIEVDIYIYQGGRKKNLLFLKSPAGKVGQEESTTKLKFRCSQHAYIPQGTKINPIIET